MSPEQLAKLWPDIQRLNRWMNETATPCAFSARCGGRDAVTTVDDLAACQECADAEARWAAFDRR